MTQTIADSQPSAPASAAAAPRRFNPRALDALNFLLADVRGAVGPYLNVFLVTQQGWSQEAVGLVTTISGLIGLLFNAPAGALIDASRAKRGLVVVALALLGLSGAAVGLFPSFWPLLAATTVMAVVGDLFGPAVAALTLGLFPRRQLARRMGRNSAFDHAGNVAIALVAALVGWAFTQRAVFFLTPLFAALAAAAVLVIPAAAIDHERAREARRDGAAQAASWTELLRHRPLVIFSLCTVLFHFANAPLLPLVGQKLALAHPAYATAMMSSCIVAAQAIMLPIAVLVGRNADRFGRKPIFLIGFGVLPLRAFLYPVSDHSAWLIGVQLLDGVGAGIFGALMPLVLADIMRGTGRYNLAQGAVAAALGAGASLSGLCAGILVDHFGYSTTFVTLGAVALVALAVFALLMPETKRSGAESGQA
ncbi:MAG TPA: MFS transporter [Roseiarcus sp.]|nr:MFS transporter [Roseiarcus sp.]